MHEGVTVPTEEIKYLLSDDCSGMVVSWTGYGASNVWFIPTQRLSVYKLKKIQKIRRKKL
jgi:hypothetical protein